MNVLVHLSVVLVSGLYTSLWGAFKDSPYETFKSKTFPRSIYFSVLIYGVLVWDFGHRQALDGIFLTQLFFLVMGVERFISEIYKGFFRTEDQEKYFIPSRMSFFGKYVQSEWIRYGVGLVFVALIFGITFITQPMVSFWHFCLVSYVTGLSVAFGGAYKDAPFEGFDIIKFQRSGLVLLCFCPFFYFLGPISLGLLIFMNIGLERFLVEYYKTYILRNMSGKFKPDTVRISKYVENRERFHYMAWVIIVLVIAIYVYELAQI